MKIGQNSGVAIAGAGFSGATVARRLAEAGYRVTVFESRDHVAGNCHTARDAQTGVIVHEYGPHIFHTNDSAVWDFVNRFTRFETYRHTVVANAGGHTYSLPINLGTINQFFKCDYSPAEAKAHLGTLTHAYEMPENFEEQALALMGEEIYRTFFEGYTRKQWGCDPTHLPASILKRMPLRFDYNCRYFSHQYEGMPRNGYTALIEAMLDHPNIEIVLNTAFSATDAVRWDHVFWTGPIDRFFDYRLGRLGYRTLDFERVYGEGDVQGCAVMNYCDADVPWTRITEHKHFAPWEAHENSVLFREYSRAAGPDDIPFYPIRLAREQDMLRQYVDLAQATSGVTFLGRLGTYRYLDMDVSVREAMDTAEQFLLTQVRDTPLPAFTTAAI
ncbi:MAG: FAD-dependent oxidoreductase [Rhodobacteraceae bacterium]|nr:MAG: FAD-dependent oxidoreductase [Paracoccaceae bacterium]